MKVAMATSEGADSDGSLSWEDFFGTSTDLVPTLLGMYDSLIGRTPPPPPSDGGGAGAAVGAAKAKAKRMSCLEAPRPLSVSSMSSSSSSSSGASSCSGRRLPKCSAYLASIESLDDSDEERPKASGSQGSGDSGVCSPPRIGHITSPCSPAGKPRYCDPNLSYMDRVVMEILDTEAVYVRDLQQVIQGYLDKWRSSPTCPLTEKQLTDLFGNIEEIYRFNKGFLEDLEHCSLDPVQIARCFVCHNEGFSIYTHYCTNYPRTVSVLTELMRQENTVRLFRERQTALQHTLPLGSYLLKPVQRILKYHLLLQNIVKNYVCEAEGYSDIVDALATMTGIAHHINNMKRRHEHAVRVQEIQSLLYGWEGEDLTTFGELCAEGAFRIYGAKAMRHAFLFDRMLLITKKKEEGILSYKTHIMCSNLMLIESVPGEPFSFHVIPFDNPRLQYTLQARNLEQKREWTMQLKRVILENYNAVIPSHARQLVMELGQNRTDDEIMADKTAPKRQHSAPEYLERRKQEKERRKSETGLRARLRRSRKSDVGLSSEEVSQPRRGRRASSSSRERSQSREGLRSVSPAKIKERFGSWRRKSEPGCYSSGRKSEEPAKLTLPPDNDIPVDEPAQPCNSDPVGAANIVKPEDDKLGEDTEVQETSIIDSSQESVVMEVEINGSDKLDVEAKTLEEIVGQLLMQNHEFQKILKKQQRHVSLRSRFLNSNGTNNSMVNKDETTDDEDGVYETLVVSSTPTITKHSSGQSYRAHRYAHMRALRNEQKTVTISGGGGNKSKRQSLISRSENDKSDSGFDADYVTLMYKRETSCALRETSEPEIMVTSKATNKGIGAKQSWVREKCNALGKNIANFPRSRMEKKGSEQSHVQEDSKDKNSNNGNYENLQQIWERVKRQQEEIRKLAESEEICREVTPNTLRRTQSFTCHEILGDMSDLDKPTLVPAASEISIDTLNIPTLPAVWLKLQGEHLATPNKKSGSLPRSFQLAHDNHSYPTSPSESECPKTGYRARLLTRDGRASSDRPFTIASDKAADINFEDIERYIDQSEVCNVRHQFPLNGDTTEEDSMTEYTTPNASLDELNVHPEYKIYRPSISKASLKHVISSMGSKLSGLKASSETLEVTELESEREQILQRERRASRLVYALARQYSKTLKQRIKTIMGEESEDCCETNLRSPSPLPNGSNTQLPIYKQGSSSLGARIAHCSEYANPRQLFPNIHLKPGSEVRPDSVLSVSSNFTSSSDGDKTSGFSGSIDTNITSPPNVNSDVVSTTPIPNSVLVEKVEELHLSDGSGDSYYERSFEAIESFLENEVFRDSAVFSDHDDIVDTTLIVTKSSKPAEKYKKLPLVQKFTKVPPPVPAKPCRLRSSLPDKSSQLEETVQYQKEEQSLVKGLEGISKSIQERRRELELWKAGMSSKEDECDTSSQHSTASTVIEVSPIRTEMPETEESPTPRGWVKHIVGMLQGDETN